MRRTRPQPFNAIRGFDPGGASSNLMVMADVNGDGRADAVMVGPANDFQPTLSVMLGQSNGQLGAPTVTGNLMTGPMVAGDLDGNGTIDLVCIGQIQNNFEISVLMNDGTGRFTQGQQIAGGGINTVNLKLLDMDGDGKPDLIFNVQGNGQIFFAKNLGGGSFATPVQMGRTPKAPVNSRSAILPATENPTSSTPLATTPLRPRAYIF